MSPRAKTVAWIVGITAVAGLTAYLTRTEARSSRDTRRSSFRSTPDGVAALYRALEGFERTALPRLTPLADADPPPATLVLLSPTSVPSPAEAGALLARVRAGGTVLYAPRLAGSVYGDIRVTPLMDSLGVRFARANPNSPPPDTAAWVEHPLTDGLPPPRTPRRGLLRPSAPSGDAEEGDAEADDAEAGDAEADDADDAGRPQLDRLLAMGRGNRVDWIGAAVATLGEGRVIFLSDDIGISNERAADDPAALLALRSLLAHTAPGDTIHFSEFHQGIRGYESAAQRWTGFLTGTATGRALLHALLAAWLSLACAGARFGSPAPALPPLERERRSPLEHAAALGDLYAKADAARTAALLLLARLARAARVPPPRDLSEAETLLDRVAATPGGGSFAAPVRAGLRSAPPDLTRIASAVDGWLALRAPSGASRGASGAHPSTSTDHRP